MRTCGLHRQEAYGADVTYGTNSEFGFDYSAYNMKFAAADFVQRALNMPSWTRWTTSDRRGAHAADHLRPSEESTDNTT